MSKVKREVFISWGAALHFLFEPRQALPQNPPHRFGFTQNVTMGPIEVPAMYSLGRQTFPRPPIMVNTTNICRIAISIGILMTLSSSVPQTREKASIETVYADRVEYSDRVGKVPDRFALPPSQPSEAYYCDSSGCIPFALPPSQPSHEAYPIRRCGVATCLVDILGPRF
jgi:hypothetical protein